MVNEDDGIMGYAMFSRFHIEGRYEDKLLILTPVAVKTELQRQHISKELLEYGFEKARNLGVKAILVESKANFPFVALYMKTEYPLCPQGIYDIIFSIKARQKEAKSDAGGL